jgi:hypothetical protein
MRQLSKKFSQKRRGVAIVEFAFVVPLLLLILLGVWELGRIISVQQTLLAAVRDGARIAAQANIVSTTGTYTQITEAQVIDAVKDSLIGNGLTNLNGVTITFDFLEGVSTREPYQGLKNERFIVKIVMPYDNVRWTNLTLFNPTTITAETQWQMMVDDPFTLNTTLPGWSLP